MVYKLISSKAIIAKIIADLDLTENNLRISDIQSWIGEAVEKIGAVNILNTKVSGEHGESTIQLRGYQASLPCDLHSLHQVAYSTQECGNWRPMRFSTGTFNKWSVKNQTCTSGCDSSSDCNESDNNDNRRLYRDDEIARVFIDMHKEFMSYAEAMAYLNSNPNAKQVLTKLIAKGDTWGSYKATTDYTYDLQYSLKPGFINCNVRDGYLKLSYSSIPRDEFGYIMVPDLASVSEAVYWYVTMKLMYPEYYKGRMRQDIYYNIRNSWNFYRKQAYAEILMPNHDGMESIKNVWNKLYPEADDHRLFYDTTGERQHLYNNNQ